MRSRINILFVIDALGKTMGGAERVLLSLIRMLPADEFSCLVVTLNLDPQTPVAQDPPCPLYVLPIKRTYGAAAIKGAFKLGSLIRKHDVDIVHTFFESSDLWGGFVAKLNGCKVISSRRDMGILRSTKHRVAYRLMAPIYDRVLAVSDEVRKFSIAQDGLSPDRVITIRNGVDMQAVTARAASRSAFQPNGQSQIVTTVANIRHVKGIDLLVDIAHKVTRVAPRVVFLVVGAISEQEYFDTIQEKIRALNLHDTIQFLGSQDNVLPILKQSDVFCLPSRSEGMSNALLEAMCCSLPSVVSRVGGNPELVQDDFNGFVFEPEDTAAAAARIIELLGSAPLRKRMGANSLDLVASRFQFSTMVDNIASLYKQVVGQA